MTAVVRDELCKLVEKYRALGAATVPIEALERIVADHPDPLETPLNLPQNEDGTWPGDPRFALQVRTIHGPSREVIVAATSLKDALNRALDLPISEWLDVDPQPAPRSPARGNSASRAHRPRVSPDRAEAGDV